MEDMSDESTIFANAIRDILKDNRELLGNKDKFTEAFEKRIHDDHGDTINIAMKSRSLIKALRDNNIGGIFYQVDGDSKEQKDKAEKQALRILIDEANMPESTAKNIIDTVVEGLDWNKKQLNPENTNDTGGEKEASVEAIKSAVSVQSDFWDCTCGHKHNKGLFCTECGLTRAIGEKKPDTEDPAMTDVSAWDCICGQKGNRGNFCIACGRMRSEAEQVLTTPSEEWECVCGHKGNKDAFCTECGRSKEEGITDVSDTTNPDIIPDEATTVMPVAANPEKQDSSAEPDAKENSKTQYSIENTTIKATPSSNADNTYNTTGNPATSNREMSAHTKKLLIGILSGTAIVLILVAGLIMSNTPETHKTASTSSSYGSVTKQGKAVREMQTDLSLGGLDLGMDIDEMHNALGKENSFKNSQDNPGYKYYYYDDLQVGVKDNVVSALVSDGTSVKTKRGISEGSSVRDVIKAYGTDYTSMDYDDMTLYEYAFRDLKGRSGILRFAITKNDKRVNYISVRITENEKKQTTTSKTSGKFGNMVKGKDNLDARITKTAGKINQYLSNHSDFRNADSLKQEAQKEIQDAQGYIKTLQSMNDVNTNDRDMLIRLFKLEIERAKGLYDGMAASSSGGSYQNGFERGRRASDEFDKQNAIFKQQ